MENIIFKKAKEIAHEMSKIIDSQIAPFIPKWQQKIIKNDKFKFLRRFFGYKLDIEHSLNLVTYTFKRYGKVLNKFAIKTTYEK
jgi:hypothetical protein